MNKRKTLTNLIYFVAVVTAVLVAWQISATMFGVSLVFPPPKESFVALAKYLVSKEFYEALGRTFVRCLTSFAMSFVLALVLALLSAMFKSVAKICSPLMAIVRAVPTMSIILILILVLMASPLQPPIFVASIVIMPTLYSAFYSAFDGVDKKLVEMCKVYNVKKSKVIFQLYLPLVADGVVEGTATGFSLNIKLIIAAEVLAQTTGSIGVMMYVARYSVETANLFALTIASIVLSVLCESLIRLFGKIFTRWKRV